MEKNFLLKFICREDKHYTGSIQIASFTLSRNTNQFHFYRHICTSSCIKQDRYILKLTSYNRATNATSQAMKNFSNNSRFCFKEVKGPPAIVKEITKGWLSQGDYNKLIHTFKACTYIIQCSRGKVTT